VVTKAGAIAMKQRVKRVGGRNRTQAPRKGHSIDLGRLLTVQDCDDATRLLAKILASEGNWVAAERAVKDLRDSKFKVRQLEILGFNMAQAEGQEVKITLTDYAQVHEEEVARNKALKEEVEALRGQIAAMQGKERPRPPRPVMN
jgi:hypothetical protein